MSAIDGKGSLPDGPSGARRDRRPGASVTLRAGGPRGVSAADMMDPAAKSLADALRITYRLLLLAMIVIVGIYLLSGLQSVREAERGVLLNFGRISGSELLPGFHWSLPRPIGEILHVSTGEVQVDLTKDFFPNLSKDDEDKLARDGFSGLVNTGSNVLDPDADGMLITGDGNIVHARLKVTYLRRDPKMTISNLSEDPDAKADEQVERRLVIAAAKRGMITATANITLDEFLKNQADPGREKLFRPVDMAARAMAQKALDEVDSGIALQQFNVVIRMPPRSTILEFNGVQAAQSERSKAIQEAESERRQKMNQTAGEAADVLVAQIDAYERELETGKNGEETLTRIHDIMLRKPVMIDGRRATPKVFGQVSEMMSDAEQYRTQVVTRARADAELFGAKLKAYKANPYVFITNEWADAIGTLLSQKYVQTMQLPGTADRLVVMINRDPEIARTETADRQEAEAKAAQERNLRERSKAQLEKKFSETGD